MDPMPPFTITPVLRAAAELKIEELNRVKESFRRRYHLDPYRSAEINPVKRISELLEDIKKLDSYLNDNDDLAIMTRFMDQAQDDKSISESKLLKFEEQLWDKLTKHLNRMEVSSLHVELMKEVMETQPASDSAASRLEKVALDDDFEVVENELEEALEEFEQATFTAKDVNVEAIETYLSNLLKGDTDNKHLERLRRDMRIYGEGLMDLEREVEQDGLMWIIMELLKNDLISPEKKAVLESYLQSPIALRELVACLNMKSFRHWRYKDAHKGLPITARLNAEGQYCITVEEDIIDMLFLNYTATGWASKLKDCLQDFTTRLTSVWPKDLTDNEKHKREFYLSPFRRAVKIKPSACSVCHPCYPPASFPPPPPMNTHSNYPIVVEASRKKEKRRRLVDVAPPPPPPMPGNDSLDHERSRDYMNMFFMSRLPTQEGCTPKVTCPQEVQARLIKTLAVETRLREAIDGKAHAFGARFDTSSIPHKTILTVLKYLGVPEAFLDFFTRFLEAKLNIGPAVRGTPDRILQRACGVPLGHGLEMLFSEAVFFFLDLSIRQKTESFMYRLHDRCYFVGTHEQRTKTVEETANFANIMGLSFKDMSGGKLLIGCLTIDTSSPSPPATTLFKIDHPTVIAYAHRVKKELDACTTVLDWVRVWNRTVGTYASHLFGPLATVFGKAHLENVKGIYNIMYKIIFNGGNLTTHVKTLLNTHIKRAVSDLPFALEALIYLPQAYGGLGVKNPFVALNLARNMSEDSPWGLENYFKMEETYYTQAAETYALCTPEQRQEKIEDMFADNKDQLHAALGPDRDLTTFMTREELTVHRERVPYPSLSSPPFPHPFKTASTPCLTDVYRDLLYEPNDSLGWSDRVCDDIRRLAGTGDMKPWRKLSGEDKWMLQLYGDECFERYGTLEIWWGEGVPIEVYKAVRGHVWSDGDDDDDDESSYLYD
ncbi:Nn.00g044700.m01.CDS01 [Neocucurbitaria sp. VM-36]